MHLHLEIYKETRFEGYDKLTFSSSDISKKKKKKKSSMHLPLCNFNYREKKSRKRL